jgi:hypothetical protein
VGLTGGHEVVVLVVFVLIASVGVAIPVLMNLITRVQGRRRHLDRRMS